MFTNSMTGNFVLLFCLVDSGASDIILNTQFAPLLGLDLTAAPSQEYQGIGDEPFRAYKHQVTIRVQAASEALTVPCAFMPDLRSDCILGQNGFCDPHKIVFEKYNKRFAITPDSAAEEIISPGTRGLGKLGGL
jgi:hypothetical protein